MNLHLTANPANPPVVPAPGTSMYTLGWASYTFASHLTGKTFTRYLPVNYCTICGRLGGVSVSQFTGQEPKVPPIGSKVFVVPSFGTNALDLNNFTIFKGE